MSPSHPADRRDEVAGAPDAAEAAYRRATHAAARARRRGIRRQVYAHANSLFHLHPGDFVGFLRQVAKWGAVGSLVGALAGTASALFLTALTWATRVRLDQPGLVWGLPAAGLLMGWLYYRFGGAAAQGNNLVIDEVNRNRARIPLRMAPLVLLGTVVTHLFGGSAGREGTAIQMGASLADGVQRLLRLSPQDRRLTIMAGISGGFGSVFGVPAAGAVFGMEVQSVGRIHYEGLIPCLVAAYVGDLVTRAWNVPHAHYPHLDTVPIQPWLLLMVVVAGVAFGLTSLLFVELTHGLKRLMALLTRWTPLYPLVGGLAVLGLTALVGTRDYLGLSLPLVEHSLDGTGVVGYAFLLKLLFTAVTLGTGYLGGEVTPLFVMGATLGSTLGTLLGVDPTFLAAIGLVAVFAGASNTPLACAIMGIELFGGGATLYLLLGCVVAYLASGHRGIYGTQVVGVPKVPGVEVAADETLHSLIARRGRGWLPPLAGFPAAWLQRPLRSIMTAPAVAVSEEATAADLAAAALRGGVRSVPVVDARHRVVGMVTDRDLRRSGLDITLTLLRQLTPDERADILAALAQTPVTAVMSAPGLTLAAAAPIAAAIRMMAQRQLKRVPVVDDTGRLLGMVTRSDLLRERVFAYPMPAAATVTVRAIPCEPAVTVAAATPVAAAIAAMRDAGHNRVVVTDDFGTVVGIVTTTDLLARVPPAARPALIAALSGQAGTGAPALTQVVADVMTAPVLTACLDTPAEDALRLLMQAHIKRLPVVDGEGRLVGLLSRAGLLHGLLPQTGGEE